MSFSRCCWLLEEGNFSIFAKFIQNDSILTFSVCVCFQGYVDHRPGSHCNLCGVVWGGENDMQCCQAAAHHTQVDRWWRWVCLIFTHCTSFCLVLRVPSVCFPTTAELWLKNTAWWSVWSRWCELKCSFPTVHYTCCFQDQQWRFAKIHGSKSSRRGSVSVYLFVFVAKCIFSFQSDIHKSINLSNCICIAHIHKSQEVS